MLTVLLPAAGDADGSAHSRTSGAAAVPSGRDASAFFMPVASLSPEAAHAGTASLSAEPCQLRLALRLQRVGAIDAAVGLGVERCARCIWRPADGPYCPKQPSMIATAKNSPI
jgi:hypothetical protein